MADSNTRYIELGSCTWCGHKPHPDECPNKIRVGMNGSKEVTEKCPCKKRS